MTTPNRELLSLPAINNNSTKRRASVPEQEFIEQLLTGNNAGSAYKSHNKSKPPNLAIKKHDKSAIVLRTDYTNQVLMPSQRSNQIRNQAKAEQLREELSSAKKNNSNAGGERLQSQGRAKSKERMGGVVNDRMSEATSK